MWFQKFTKKNQFCPKNPPKIVDAFMFFPCFFLKVVLQKQRPFFHKKETTFLKQFSKFFASLFSSLNSRTSKNMCKLRHQISNGKNLSHGSPNFKHFQSKFSNKIFAFHFRLTKTQRNNPSLENAQGLYVFESMRQETKIELKKSELNF